MALRMGEDLAGAVLRSRSGSREQLGIIVASTKSRTS
jgi:hypothetical protein